MDQLDLCLFVYGLEVAFDALYSQHLEVDRPDGRVGHVNRQHSVEVVSEEANLTLQFASDFEGGDFGAISLDIV